MFRPGYVQPVGGAVSRTPLYPTVYRITAGLYPLLRRVAPRYVTTTRAIGRAMLAVTYAEGTGPSVRRNGDINDLSLSYGFARASKA
ncbi:hypothetical protein ACFY8O_30345 [Streptomyces argenteolus]|uniref:Uncharacterized protein n=1 Tax=Streptomyces argenteolus TaxID=67274 RepID=A0ABW6XEL5_9ACTN